MKSLTVIGTLEAGSLDMVRTRSEYGQSMELGTKENATLAACSHTNHMRPQNTSREC